MQFRISKPPKAFCFKFNHLTAGKWHVIIMSMSLPFSDPILPITQLQPKPRLSKLWSLDASAMLLCYIAYPRWLLPSQNVHSSQPTSSRAAFLPHEDSASRQQRRWLALRRRRVGVLCFAPCCGERWRRWKSSRNPWWTLTISMLIPVVIWQKMKSPN